MFHLGLNQKQYIARSVENNNDTCNRSFLFRTCRGIGWNYNNLHNGIYVEGKKQMKTIKKKIGGYEYILKDWELFLITVLIFIIGIILGVFGT